MSTLITPSKPTDLDPRAPLLSPQHPAPVNALSKKISVAPPADGRIKPTTLLVDDDAQMVRAVKMGVLVGIPSVFLIAAGIGLLAGTGLGVAAMIGAWSGLFGGTYMGGLFFIHPSKRRSQNAAAAGRTTPE